MNKMHTQFGIGGLLWGWFMIATIKKKRRLFDHHHTVRNQSQSLPWPCYLLLPGVCVLRRPSHPPRSVRTITQTAHVSVISLASSFHLPLASRRESYATLKSLLWRVINISRVPTRRTFPAMTPHWWWWVRSPPSLWALWVSREALYKFN